MTITNFVLKGDLNGIIVVVRFFFVGYSLIAIFRQFCFIKISNSLHSLYVRVKICVMAYLNVKGQGQIDIFKITILCIFN